ncbi:tail fiber domain-containing protein [uncultured Imperialibacter sp.]|uniref:tail fiber domain-containing protein n=1 Tax=uncultured Imperialibacter sp. TaxID=1672639 RepID=UPI0030DAE5FC|tara:strand:+ start:267151 stop:270351 length:3201 start_codon:yes stop_codon:yes gene_type:complete
MKALVTTLAITLISFTASSQKLPFQGQLIENGTPVTGTRDFVFNIPDGVGGSLWTETHIGVQVQDGLYSLVLGDIATLPDELFSDVSERTLEITVGAISLSPITLYAGIKEWKFTKEMDGSTDRPAILGEISGPASNWAAIEGYASTDGDNYGVYGQGEGTGKINVGLYGFGLGTGDGSVTDFQGAWGSYNYGAMAIAKDNLNGNVGVWGRATGDAGAADNIGVVGWSEITGGVENKGMLGWAKGTGINKGVVGLAEGGTENWAGWFDGDVKINGNLVMDGGANGSSTFTKTQDSSTGEYIVALKGEVNGTGVFDSQGAGVSEYNGIMGVGNAIEGGNTGVRGVANVSATSASFNYGVYGQANSDQGNTTAVIYGLRGEANGPSSFSVGVRGISGNSTPGSGNNFGGDFSAGSNPVQNIGLRGRTNGDTGGGSENIGVYGLSSTVNSTRNIGVYGKALSATSENWAGWFEGDVKVTGTLSVDGQGGSISATGINQDYGNFGEKDWETGLQGYLDLRGDAEAGKDNIRIALGVEKAGSETVGSFSLFGPVYNDVNCPTCPRSFVSANLSNDPGGNAPAEWSGSLQLSGQESPNVIIGGQNYQDSDLGHISLFGNKPDGNGWFYSHAGLQVNQDGSQEWGSLRLEANDGVSNVEIGAKSWEDPTNGAGRPYFRMRGNTPDQDLVWMEVADDGLGNELGAVSFNGTDGANLRIDANGLSGDIKNIYMKRATLQSEWGNDGQGALELRDANDQTRIQASVNDDGASTYSGHINLTNSADGGFVTLDGQWGVRSSAMLAVAQGSNPANNSIEMGNDQDAGYMNVNDASNANIITLSGVDGSINVKNGLVNVATGENNGNTSGTVNLGATSAGHGLRMYGGYDFDSDGNVRSHIALDGPGSYVYIWGDGSVNASNSVSAEGDMFATNFNTTSDGRLKENITPIEHSLANTLKLRGVSYNWVDKAKSQSRQIGVIAQEVEKVYPEFVHTNEEGMKSVNYAQMVAVLIEAIKELNTQIETLKTENASLKTELATASNNEKRITELEASVKSLVNLLQAPSKPSDENSISLGKQE